MKVRELMTGRVVSVSPDESVEVAARTLAQHNVGALPVCTASGKICGMVTDRDLVIRCMAAQRQPNQTKVKDVMTSRVLSVQPDMEAGVAAHLMGRQQVRRLPVTQDGKLCGMISLGDLASREESVMDAADALSDITSNIAEGNAW